MDVWSNIKEFFYKKDSLEAVFIDELRRRRVIKVTPKGNTFVVKEFGDNLMYVVNYKYLIFDPKRNVHVGFWYRNNPVQIPMNHERNHELDSVGLREIIESKVVKDLFSENTKNLLMIIIIILCGVGLLCMWSVGIGMKWIKPGGGG